MTDFDNLLTVIENNQKAQFMHMMNLATQYPWISRFGSTFPLMRCMAYAYCHELVRRTNVPIWPLELPSGIINMRKFGCFGDVLVTVSSRKLRTHMIFDDNFTFDDAKQLGINVARESAELIDLNLPCVYAPYIPIVLFNFNEKTGIMRFGSREALTKLGRDNFSMRVMR